MEGRWARLAVSAHTRGYLDYSQITRFNVLSIVKERLVLDEIERERVSELLKTKSIVTAICFDDAGAASQANISEYISINLPWMVTKKDPSIPVQKGNSDVEKLIEAYHKHQESKEKK